MADPSPGDPDRPRGAGVGATTWRGRAYIVRIHVEEAWHHPANAGHRLDAVGRVLRFYARGYLRHARTLTPLGTHSRIWADTDVTSTARVVISNPPDWAAAQVWRRLLGPSSLFIDVGANVGTYALWATDLGATVVAIEPDDGARSKLLENAALNGASLEVHQVALADEPGVLRFTRGLGTMNHLLAKDAEEPGGVEVTVSTLDTVLGDRKADGAKIDVEGAERLVLEGATRALAEGRLPVIQLEWNSMAALHFGEDRTTVADLLGRYGYRLFRPDDQGSLTPFDEDTPGAAIEVFAVLGDLDRPAD
jgi:FkbM family methyltransferase